MEHINYIDDGQFCSGHVACGGCVEALALRVIMNTIGPDAIGVVAPSCSAVILGGHPMSSVRIPFIHGTLESAAASASGVKRALVAKGKPDTTVLCLAGDGGTYDIGLQSLSSAAERNEDILYVCFDNEGYMNTGGQKSSSTPKGAATGSTPKGKTTRKKNMIEILAAHRIPYLATASPSDLNDLAAKVTLAKSIRGTKVLIVLIPCLPGWGVADDSAVKTARHAVDAGVFPLMEIFDGKEVRLNSERVSSDITDYLGLQKRYRHLSAENIRAMQAEVDADCSALAARAENGAGAE